MRLQDPGASLYLMQDGKYNLVDPKTEKTLPTRRLLKKDCLIHLVEGGAAGRVTFKVLFDENIYRTRKPRFFEFVRIVYPRMVQKV